jgi:UPF0716 protein FxsA
VFVLALVLIFIVLPIAEIYVIVQVGDLIGVWWTLAILIADSIVGAMLVRWQGRTAWRRFTEALASGRPPAREVLDGGLIIFGGALQIAPGFITDVLGMLLLLPPTRAIFRRVLVRRYARRLVVGLTGRTVPRDPGARSDYDVEGTAHEVEVDPPHLRP